VATIFEETTIAGMALRNRLVRSATWEGMCDAGGGPTPRLENCYVDLARGGVGLIITGYAFVSPEGRQLPGQMGIHTDEFADGFERLFKAVHAAGGKIAVQLVHAGGQTDARNAGQTPLAPSAVKVDQYGGTPTELTTGDIQRIVEDFGAAAKRARAYGADAVQLHAAHGYLINQFLSPHTNKRTDGYGGDIAGRARFLMEVFRRVCTEAGAGFPVLVKLTGGDNLEGGLENSDAAEAARMLSEAGVDAIEVSGGTPASGELNPARQMIITKDQEAYNMDAASAIREAVKCPLMVVGGFRSYDVVEEAVSSGRADYISMARPFIREPGLAARWERGERSPATCISCNGCFMPGIKEGGIYCVVDNRPGYWEGRD